MPAMLSRLAVAGPLALVELVSRGIDREIGAVARSDLVTERIEGDRWDARACGRGRYVCVEWEGSLGKARVKGYLGGSPAAPEVIERWRSARERGAPLEVEWGRTPSGWMAARTAAAGTLRAHNAWP